MAKLKPKIFSSADYAGGVNEMQSAIDDYIDTNGIGPADLMNVTQSESVAICNVPTPANVTIVLWYVEHSADRDWLVAGLPETDEPVDARPGVEYGV